MMFQIGKTYRVDGADGATNGAAWSGSTTHDYFDDEGDEQHYDGNQEEPDCKFQLCDSNNIFFVRC